MSLDFYDRHGAPTANSEDGKHIFNFGGQPVAYISQGSVYSFAGAHSGRFENGLIRDINGDVVLFIEGASGGPLKQLKPLKGLKGLKPMNSIKALNPLKPVSSSSWSQFSSEQFFQ